MKHYEIRVFNSQGKTSLNEHGKRGLIVG